MAEIIQLFPTDRDRGKGPDSSSVVKAHFSFDIKYCDDGYYHFVATDYMNPGTELDLDKMRAFLGQFNYFIQPGPGKEPFASVLVYGDKNGTTLRNLSEADNFKKLRSKWWLLKQLFRAWLIIVGWAESEIKTETALVGQEGSEHDGG
jgi:hypothetical protein